MPVSGYIVYGTIPLVFLVGGILSETIGNKILYKFLH